MIFSPFVGKPQKKECRLPMAKLVRISDDGTKKKKSAVLYFVILNDDAQTMTGCFLQYSNIFKNNDGDDDADDANDLLAFD